MPEKLLLFLVLTGLTALLIYKNQYGLAFVIVVLGLLVAALVE